LRPSSVLGLVAAETRTSRSIYPALDGGVVAQCPRASPRLPSPPLARGDGSPGSGRPTAPRSTALRRTYFCHWKAWSPGLADLCLSARDWVLVDGVPEAWVMTPREWSTLSSSGRPRVLCDLTWGRSTSPSSRPLHDAFPGNALLSKRGGRPPSRPAYAIYGTDCLKKVRRRLLRSWLLRSNGPKFGR